MGVIENTLPLALYSVRLANGRPVRASTSEATRHATTRLIPGDRVVVRLSVHDPNRGQITRKL
jgi:translation initiation factor IF-1